MSKPISGHFQDTKGFKSHPDYASSKKLKQADELSEKEKFTPHPLKRKQLSPAQRKKLKAKKENRTITKEEYKHLEWNRRLAQRRNKAIDRFWRHEKKRLKANLPGTRNWTDKQKQDILNNKRPKFKGRVMKSHHLYSVAQYPHLADRPDLIFPATDNEHFNGFHGGNYANSLPGRQIKYVKDF